MEIRVYTKEGYSIRGTSEMICAVAPVDFRINEKGELDYDHNGDGSEIFWDTSTTQTKKGTAIPLMLANSGEDYPLDELVVKAVCEYCGDEFEIDPKDYADVEGAVCPDCAKNQQEDDEEDEEAA